MERAFEVQPSNDAIQAELQRLYGKRDGMEPPKIRMTRSALARIYVQGELYPQAIAEIRGVLAEDPQRADMQVLLALSYFKSGQKSDATDVCNQLLKNYPYAFDANRIMVELLPATTGSVESTQVYRMRVGEMDPYANFSKGSIFQSNEVADASISLEKLEYKGEEVQLENNWGSSLGIDLGSSAVPAMSSNLVDDQPDWLKDVGLGAMEQTPPTSGMSGSEPQPQDEIPDFLRQAGWGESTGPEQPTSIFDDEPIESGDLVAADLPDWLKGQAPTKEPVSSQTSASSSSSDDVLETPDWLSGIGSSDPLESIQNEPANTPSNADLPDWLSGLGGDQPMSNSNADDETLQPTNLPDWLQQVEPKKEAEIPSANIESLGASSSEQDDAVAWLESLAAKHGANPEELV
ncbi:MAG: tetratricopeptide repeat protein, partial [Anaerolineales bacterium]